MKNYNQIEVILFTKYSFNDPNRRELIKWLGTTAQSAISQQQVIVKKLFLRLLKDTPAIYMS
jgi:hypothetical protein